MTAPRRLVPIVFVILAIITVGMSIVRTNAEQAATMTEAAQAFLETLTPAQRDATLFSFNGEDRLDWHFIPANGKGSLSK